MKTAEKLKQAFIRKHGYSETRLMSHEPVLFQLYVVNEELTSDLDEYAEQVAKEREYKAFDEGWVSAWKENGEINLAELSYQDRAIKTVQEYFNDWINNKT